MVELTLEELIGKEQLDSISGKRFGIIDVKMNRDGVTYGNIPNYERKEFVERAGDLFDVEEYYAKLKQNSNDMDALKDLIKIAVDYVPGDKKRMKVLMQENPHLAISQADSLYSYGTIAMAKYIEKNRSKVFDKLNEKQLYSVFQKTPSYITGNKEYDRIKVLKEKIKQMQEAEENKMDISLIVRDEFQELIERIPEEQRKFISDNADLVMPVLNQSLIHGIQRAYRSLFRDAEGNPIKSQIVDYLKANYKVAEDFMENEIPKDKPFERFDVWDKRLKPHYIELARELYRPEKKEVKKDKDKDKEERKAKANDLGIGY